MFKIMGFILLAMSFSAQAESTYLYTEVSNSGETLDAFVTRIAPDAIAASKRARSTVCGRANEADGRFYIEMKTDGYVSDCSLPRSDRAYVLVNGTATDARENHFSLQNRERPGYLITPWAVKYRDPAGTRTVSSF